MPSRPELLLDAAIAVLGCAGIRQLTHRAVDAAAGLPPGSTSNYFATRDALIEGIADRFTTQERSGWETIAAYVQPKSAPELASALSTFARRATGPERALTVARYSLFLEAALRPSLQEQLGANARSIRRWAAPWLAGLGSADPERDAQLVLDQLDGIMLHQLAFPDPAFDPEPALIRLLTALLRQG
ncbi:MAG TPA: TetR family transcriptional regulator [Streptosporangiaceae bacterium]|jgi:DNA-binding transcriptional regulator YbjK